MIPKNTKNIADLFSGRGTFSYALATKYSLDAYETDISAVEAVLSTKPPFKIILRDLFQTPLTARELNNYDVIILDPPRAGAFDQAKELIKSKVKRIIYISCNPLSLKKDLELLKDYFSIHKVFPVDQFLWTAHLEMVVVLDKKEG